MNFHEIYYERYAKYISCHKNANTINVRTWDQKDFRQCWHNMDIVG